MKYRKVIGLFALVAAASMAFAASASATTVTSSQGSTPSFHAEQSQTLVLHTSWGEFRCKEPTISGKIEQHGSGVTAAGRIGSLILAGCNYPSTIFTAGTLEFHGVSTTGNATVTSTGLEFTVHGPFGINCLYATSSTDIGTLTGGTLAKVDFNNSLIPRTGDSALCGSTGELTGGLIFVAPHVFEFH